MPGPMGRVKQQTPRGFCPSGLHMAGGERVRFGLLFMLALLPLAAAADLPSPQRQQALIQFLKQDCGSCHGMTLQGGLGPALLPQSLAAKPDELLVTTILKGRPGTAMPPWESFLSRDEAAWLVAQLRAGLKTQAP